MAADCAACLRPIAKGDKFVLSGTEVFHGRCAMSRGTSRSVRTRLELRAIEAERDAEILRGQLEHERREVAEVRRMVRKATDDVRQIDTAVRMANQAKDAAERDRAYWKERASEIERERDQSRRELEIARAASVATPAPAAQLAKDDRDATEIRFSLLELDKP